MTFLLFLLSIIKIYFGPISFAIDMAVGKGANDYDGGKTTQRAMDYFIPIWLVEFLPIPRTLCVIIAVFRSFSAELRFKESCEDSDGLGGGAFGDLDTGLFVSFLVSLVGDLLVLGLYILLL